MKVENLPEIKRIKKDRVCYVCKEKIKKGTDAVYYWWVKKTDSYSHISCSAKKIVKPVAKNNDLWQ